MDGKELKQTLRKLKRQEFMFRYGFSKEYIERNLSSQALDQLPLVWKDFFDLNNSNRGARYSFSILEKMDKEQVKQVIGEYWFAVYYRVYHENTSQPGGLLPPELLTYLGLPFDADSAAVKKRFRELYKVYHPDEGGDAEQFIELLKMRERFKETRAD